MFGDAEVDINALKSVRTGKTDNGNQRVHNWNVIAIELEVSYCHIIRRGSELKLIQSLRVLL